MQDDSDKQSLGGQTGASIGGVAPAREDAAERPMTEVRDAIDASDSEKLRRNPSSEDAKLDVAIDETFPGSDAPSNTQPGKGKDPAPSSGYDPEAEAAR